MVTFWTAFPDNHPTSKVHLCGSRDHPQLSSDGFAKKWCSKNGDFLGLRKFCFPWNHTISSIVYKFLTEAESLNLCFCALVLKMSKKPSP